MRRVAALATIAFLIPFAFARPVGAQDGIYQVGVAKIDVTPDYAIRLAGYAARTKESEGVEQRIWAKAMAVGSDTEGVSLLIMLDNCGVPDSLTEELAGRLKATAGIARDHLVLCSTHTHSAPLLLQTFPNMFGSPIPAEQEQTCERYARELIDKLEKVSLEAIANRAPARLSWAQGEAPFAANRRTQGGPVEHAMPVLCVTDPDGKLRALIVNYACHCTTLGPDLNKICGDWAGYAQEAIEHDHPGAIAFTIIGCAGDANPQPRGNLPLARQHGRTIADETNRLLNAGLKPITSPLKTGFKRIALAFDPLPTRKQWEEMAKRKDAVGGNARLQLAKLDRGEALPTELPYTIATWTFGDDLAMVFLAGEVVVDYDLRLRHEFDSNRLWITAYANSVPCYIPSRRILAEGGYEAADAMTYYARPARLAPSVENDIIRTVHELLPTSFRSRQSLNDFPLPLSPREALAAFRTHDDLEVELVASEPLIEDPVWIDWGPDGKLWVVEMNDYPTGLHENHTPGGRIKVLEDTKGDGHYDQATLFLDGLRMPTGVMPWKNGALVCAAPDILYAEDTKHSGKATSVETLVTGFGPANEQWLVNGMTWGLDNWLYGASSISNGPIRVVAGGKTIDLGQRDFRMHPETADFEPASGRTQYGRVRDDWDNWFGNDNSNLLFHYPLPEHYLRRNPHVSPPGHSVLVPTGYDVNQLYPASRILERFNDPGSAGRTTSACGPVIYRDDLLGNEFTGNAFACEPVHNLVTRLVLEPDGATFHGHRARGEEHSEFLGSTDNWFRPVQARTGPDGALWVVDMYRFVIEHPRWITPERLARLDIRAGADKGRIYRIYPKNRRPRAIPNLTRLKTEEVAKLMDGPNGPLRDLVQRELITRGDRAAVAVLEKIASSGNHPAARAQAMWTLDGLNALPTRLVERALADPHAGVRRQALRLAEAHLATAPSLAEAALRLVNDADAGVRYQLGLSLGEWNDPRAADALGRLAVAGLEGPWQRAAVLSSCAHCPAQVLAIILKTAPESASRTQMIQSLAATAGADSDPERMRRFISLVAPPEKGDVAEWQIVALSAAMDAGADEALSKLLHESTGDWPKLRERTSHIYDQARQIARNGSASAPLRLAAIGLLGRTAGEDDTSLRLLAGFLEPAADSTLRAAALKALSRSSGEKAAMAVLEHWPSASPTLRDSMLQMLMQRKAWTGALLDAIEQKKVRPVELAPAARARLLASSNADLRKRAESLLVAAISSRQKALDELKAVTQLRGDAAKGAAIFARTCTTCHQLGGQGNAVGPDLSALTDRSPQALLIAIVDPNAAVDGKYINYIVELRDGRTLSGIITDETANGLTVLQPNGIRDAVSRTQITSIRSSGLSLMPEGLEAGLSRQDLADLIAYVASAGRVTRPKQIEGNKPRTVTAEADGRLMLLASDCEIFGSSLVLESQYKNLGMWNSDNDFARWDLSLASAGNYEVWIDYACDPSCAGNSFTLRIGEQSLSGTVASTGNWSTYRRIKLGQVHLASGKQEALLRPAGKIAGALLDLKSIELKPQQK